MDWKKLPKIPWAKSCCYYYSLRAGVVMMTLLALVAIVIYTLQGVNEWFHYGVIFKVCFVLAILTTMFFFLWIICLLIVAALANKVMVKFTAKYTIFLAVWCLFIAIIRRAKMIETESNLLTLLSDIFSFILVFILLICAWVIMSYFVEMRDQSIAMVEEGRVPQKTIIRAYLTSPKNQSRHEGDGKTIAMQSEKGRILVAKDVLKPQVIQSLESNISLNEESLLFISNRDKLSSNKQNKKK